MEHAGKEQEVPVEELYGIARKVTLELTKLPIHQHSAVTEMINVGIQVRNLGAQRAEKLRVEDAQAAHKQRELDLHERQINIVAEQTQLERARLEREVANELKVASAPATTQ